MNVIIFDTETVSATKQWLIDIGYRIVDIDLHNHTATTLCKKDYLVLDLINNELFVRNVEFGGDSKYEMWQALLENKIAIKHNFVKIMELISKDIQKYGVLFGYAYNAPFDVDKFNKECLRYGCANPLENLPVFDIWRYVTYYITNTAEYLEFCKEHNLITDSGRFYQTSVEAVTKYLLNNPNFEESHTALDDTQYELMILLECFKRGADITRQPKNFNKDGKWLETKTNFTETILLCGTATAERYDDTVILKYSKQMLKNGIRRLY